MQSIMQQSKKTRPNKKEEEALTLDEVFGQIALTSTSTPGLNNIVLTPISSEACLRHGINPDYLRKRNFETFHDNDQTDLDIQRLKYETYERRRHDLMALASEETFRIKKKNPGDRSLAGGSVMSLSPSAVLRAEDSAFLEIEEKRQRKAKEKQRRE